MRKTKNFLFILFLLGIPLSSFSVDCACSVTTGILPGFTTYIYSSSDDNCCDPTIGGVTFLNFDDQGVLEGIGTIPQDDALGNYCCDD